MVVSITEHDVALLRVLDKYRLLDARQLFAALGASRNRRSFGRRLEELYHAKGGSVLDRPRAQFRPGHPARPYVYAVGPAGRRELDRLDGIVRTGRRDVRNENERLQLQFIEHEIAVAEVALSFALASAAQGWRFEVALQHEVAAASGLPPTIDITFRQDITERLPLRPDCHFVITSESGRAVYLVEVDLGTEPQIRWNFRTSSILRKVCAYWELSRWNSRPVDGVIFVTTTAKRLSNMIDVVRAVDPKGKGSHYFHFVALEHCRIERHAELFYAPFFRSAKVGYENPRPLWLQTCPHCDQSVDPENEVVHVVNAPKEVILAPASTAPEDLMPDAPIFAHTECPGLRVAPLS